MVRFLVLFVVLLLALFGLELWQPVQNHLVVPWTGLLAKISTGLASTFDSDVVSKGKVMYSAASGAGVSIEAGCNGVEAALLLTAAVLAYPSSWRMKFLGIVLGFLAIQVVNILRVITLYYMAGWNREIFTFAHLYLWQALIMLDVLIVWLLWINRVAREENRGEPSTA